jgi:hypothetical protein
VFSLEWLIKSQLLLYLATMPRDWLLYLLIVGYGLTLSFFPAENILDGLFLHFLCIKYKIHVSQILWEKFKLLNLLDAAMW